ncbi:MAG: phosphoglycolate phosphatase [Pseudorhodobacter sp.]|nr:phosphoglycolate phosphatase [Pseudorhodobacter sp.]
MTVVIFDLDGTLIDSAPDIHAASNRVLAAEGFAPLSLPQVRSFIGKGVPHLVARLLEASGEAPNGPRHAAMVARFSASYESAVGLTRPYPGVAAALDALAATGLRLGLCTNKPVAPARAVLRHLGLNHHFAALIGGDSLPQRKPDPAPLLAVLAALGGGAAVYVGDSEVDAATAAAARLPFALFTEGYRKTPVADLPHAAAFADFAALPGIIAKLAAG